MKILIQIPCFNEELQIKNIIEDIRKSLDTNNYDYEIVIIDDGSTDRTIAIAKENGVKNILSLKRNMGLGFAFNKGRIFALEQGADILVNTDADNQYKSEYIKDLIENLKNSNTDIVIE